MSERPTELAFIALGSNIEPEYHLPEAILRLQSVGRMEAVSRAYQSQPLGGRKQPEFLNAAVLLALGEEPAALRILLREVEKALDRVRTEDKYAARTIDLDLVLLGDRVDPEFPLPDPDILIHEHLAVPLAELDPDFCHPITHEALGAIAARLRSEGLQPHEEVSQHLSVILAEAGRADSPD